MTHFQVVSMIHISEVRLLGGSGGCGPSFIVPYLPCFVLYPFRNNLIYHVKKVFPFPLIFSETPNFFINYG
jgi:hypothetical protein